MSASGKKAPDDSHPAKVNDSDTTAPAKPELPDAIDFEKLCVEERAEEERKMVREETPKIKTAIKSYLSSRMAEAMTQCGGVSPQLQLMARYLIKGINSATPPKEGGGVVVDCWRLAAAKEGAKATELFGKRLVLSADFSILVKSALESVVIDASSKGSAESDTSEAIEFLRGFVATASEDPAASEDHEGQIIWSNNWQDVLQQRQQKRDEAARQRLADQSSGKPLREVRAFVEELKGV